MRGAVAVVTGRSLLLRARGLGTPAAHSDPENPAPQNADGAQNAPSVLSETDRERGREREREIKREGERERKRGRARERERERERERGGERREKGRDK